MSAKHRGIVNLDDRTARMSDLRKLVDTIAALMATLDARLTALEPVTPPPPESPVPEPEVPEIALLYEPYDASVGVGPVTSPNGPDARCPKCGALQYDERGHHLCATTP